MRDHFNIGTSKPTNMKVLVVITHPNNSSFNHALLERVSQGLNQAGHEVKIKDLYAQNFDPVLKESDLEQIQTGKTPKHIAKEQNELLWADGLVFIYPLWWFGRPAMLKGWFDVVLTNGLAFEYSEEGVKGLLKHQKAQIIITAGGSENYFLENNALELIHRPITDGTLSFCGVKDISHKIYYDIANISDKERNSILDEAEQIGKEF